MAGARPLGSARAPRHRRHERSACGAGRPRDTAAGRQCHRRSGRGRRRARCHFTKRHWHRRRSFRAGVVGARQKTLRAEFRRVGARRVDASVLHRQAWREKRPGIWSQFGHRTGCDLRIRRAAETLRKPDVQGDVRARGTDRRRRLGAGRTPPRRSARRRQGVSRQMRIRGKRSSPAIARPICTASSATQRSPRRCGCCRRKDAMRFTAAISRRPSSPRSRAAAG